MKHKHDWQNILMGQGRSIDWCAKCGTVVVSMMIATGKVKRRYYRPKRGKEKGNG